MSGAHLPICKKLLGMMKSEGIEDIPVVVGGVIPKRDIPKLKEMGVEGVFPGGTSFDDIVIGIRGVVR
jgi:methylmalonyl-CoA mutase C-terminal domain/subunit